MPRSRPAMLAALVCALTLSACTRGPSPSDAARTVPERTGEPAAVDVCRLVGEREVRKAMGVGLRVVGRRLEAPALPTETCLWGTEFAVPTLEVQVTPGPVAEDTFGKAFGPEAGGDPQRVEGLGDAAYARDGLTDRTLQVLHDGAVVVLEGKDRPGSPLPEEALRQVAAAVLEAMPGNPRLPSGRPGPPCGQVPSRLVADVLGGEPRLRRMQPARGGAVMCSWAALPGSLVVTVRTDPVQVNNFRANLTPGLYRDVRGTGAETYSQNGRAGDVLMFLGDRMVEVDSLPGSGYESADTPTRPAERRLAVRLRVLLG